MSPFITRNGSGVETRHHREDLSPVGLVSQSRSSVVRAIRSLSKEDFEVVSHVPERQRDAEESVVSELTQDEIEIGRSPIGGRELGMICRTEPAGVPRPPARITAFTRYSPTSSPVGYCETSDGAVAVLRRASPAASSRAFQQVPPIQAA